MLVFENDELLIRLANISDEKEVWEFRQEFLDEYYNSDHYRPELPSSNRSHKGENVTDDYFGD